MEFTKITSEDTQNKGVVGLADTPNLTTGEMQKKFDELATDVIIPKFNNLCDELEAAEIDKRVKSDEITNMRRSEDNTLQVSVDGGETYKELSSAGHVIMNGSGIAATQRSKMQFSSNVVITDDPVRERTFIQIPSGEKGDKGDSSTITVGNVTEGDRAEVTNSGSQTDAILNFVLPKGDKGDAADIQVGTVTSGVNPSVSNRGTSSNAIFDFVLPKGEKGDVGQGINILGEFATLADLQAAHPVGNPGNSYMVGIVNPKDLYIWDTATRTWTNEGALQGVKGDSGDAGTITVGTVTQGTTTKVENVGTSENAILNFTLEKGDKGDQGIAGTIAIGTVVKGDNAAVVNVGTPSAAVLNMVLPKGDKGDPGDPAIVNGKSGASINITPADMAMEGYVKGTTEASILDTDSLNEAIGKLEFKADSAGKNETMDFDTYEALSDAEKNNHTLRIITDRNNADEGNVADKFDATKTYAKGDIVIYNNITYEAKEDILTAGSFDGLQWERKTIGNVVQSVSSNLTDLSNLDFTDTSVPSGTTTKELLQLLMNSVFPKFSITTQYGTVNAQLSRVGANAVRITGTFEQANVTVPTNGVIFNIIPLPNAEQTLTNALTIPSISGAYRTLTIKTDGRILLAGDSMVTPHTWDIDFTYNV